MRVEKSHIYLKVGDVEVAAYSIHACCKDTVRQGNVVLRQSEVYHVCSKHGEVKLIPFYEKVVTDITKETHLRPYWACAMCVEDNIGTICEAAMDVCKECFKSDVLIECLQCGESVCMRHSVNDCCLDCVEEMGKGLGSYH